MENLDEKILQAIYDTLYSAYANPPAGLKLQGTSQTENVYLTLNWPGQQISVEDFANPWSVNNPGGSTDATKNFSILVDNLLAINPIASMNGQTLSKVYAMALDAKVTPPAEDPTAKAEYDKAYNFLHADGVDYDDMGKPISVKVDSPVYVKYSTKMREYNNALAAFLANYFQYDMTKPDDQRKWSLLGPTYLSNVNAAYNDWVNANKTRVEDMLAVESQYANNQVGKVFKESKSLFDSMKRSDPDSPTNYWYPSYAQPANWFAPNAASQWSSVTIQSDNLRTSEHSDFSKITAGGQARWGMWNFGASFDKSDEHQSMNKNTEHLSVKFKFCKVQINRPWYNHLIFSLGGWSLGNSVKKSGFSNGHKDQPLGNIFPLLPTSFIAIRDLEISADFAKEEASMISSKIAGKTSFGWGPFCISGSYEHGSSDKKFASSFDGKTIRNNGLQIIGWINALVPESPKM